MNAHCTYGHKVLASILTCLGAICLLSCGGADAEPVPAPPPRIQVPAPASQTPTETESRPETAAPTLPSAEPQAFLTAQQTAAADVPFVVKMTRIGLEGGCARGDVPQKRADAAGIRAVVHGTLTWQGTDLLYGARLDGALFVAPDAQRMTVVPPFASPAFLAFDAPRTPQFEPAVRGVAPWAPGESRPFRFVSAALNEVWCEANPHEVHLLLAVEADGLVTGKASWPLGVWPLAFEEVVGMALRQQVRVEDRDALEAADAHFTRLDKMLVTRLTGRMEWLPRSRIVHDTPLQRARGTVFPAEAAAADWLARLHTMATQKEFGGYAPRGEDQFLTVLSLELVNGTMDAAALKDVKFRLETAPGVWVTPVKGALGQIDLGTPLSPSETRKGSVVFPRQRFERPFRLEVTTPKKDVLLLDAFDYSIGPERSPLAPRPADATTSDTP
ncbi:MAG: hypothetical protein GX146_01200 [Myxococcales bacterium]|nr:hypothetical protein [Myxococcales bacterium]